MPSTTIPTVPERCPYTDIQEWMFTVEPSLTNDGPDWSLEDLGRLARLAADLRCDIILLEQIASEVDGIVTDAVNEERNRGMKAVA